MARLKDILESRERRLAEDARRKGRIPDKPRLYLDAVETAEALGIHPSSIRYWVRHGKITGIVHTYRHGAYVRKVLMFHHAEVQRVLRERLSQATLRFAATLGQTSISRKRS